MTVAWDPFKSGGYSIMVKFKDNPEYIYHYNYKVFNRVGNFSDWHIDNTLNFYTTKDGEQTAEGRKYPIIS